jgi:MYXO-CTERM domain-containing protein
MSKTTLLIVAAGLVAAALPTPAAAQCDAPELMIILDKSSSMITGTDSTGEAKWNAAARAVNSITTRFGGSLDFGLLVFPNPDRCSVTGVAVDVGPGTSAEIATYLATPPPTAGNYTPMSQALDVAAAYAPLSDPSRRRVAVLITDGWQWCYPYDAATRFDPVEHAAALRATGTTLYVVGFGDGVDALTLNQLAYDSGTSIPGCDPTGDTPTTADPCYQRAEDTTSLEAVLDTIARHTAEEICDGLDNDCDGTVDDGLSRACSTLCGAGTETCAAGAWVGCTAPAPAVEEACDGSRDDDCDGVVDEGCDCADGAVRACGVDVGGCAAGTQFCDAGAWSACDDAVGPVAETCNRADDDCDGTTDEGCLCADGDTRVCGTDAGACSTGTQLCRGGAWADCAGDVAPSAEACDGADNDCDGTVDEDCDCRDGETRPCGSDVGVCAPGVERCAGGTWSACEGAVEPQGEVCDGLDDDCNGTADDGAACPPGLACLGGVCVTQDDGSGDDVVAPLDDSGAAGCGCSLSGGAPLSGLLGLLGVLALLALRPRRRA